LLKRIILINIAILFALINVDSFAVAPVYDGIQLYQKNAPLSPERKQKLADDINRYHRADNLWDALREEFTLPHYEEVPAVQEKIEWFMNNQDFLLRSATRAAPYLYYILQQVKKRHLPAELVLLPIVESGYNPYSLSNVGAAGIWQLMPNTATGLGVKQDWWYDGRRDVIASTRAALNYLAYLQSFFDGNWLLAIAAYNTGEGNVMSAIKRNIRKGLDTDFWSLPVAQQTKDYVPSLLALAVIISQPERYPVYFPPVRNAPYLAQVDLNANVSLKDAAGYAGISYKKLLQLNPGFKQPAASLQRAYKLVLPIENVVDFTENIANATQNTFSQPPQVRWMHYKVKTGDTLASIANKFNTTPKEIRQLNRLTKNAVRQGNHLLIPKIADVIAEREEPKSTFTATEKVKPTLSYNKPSSSPYIMQPGDTIYMVRKKDSLASIAKRFRLDSHSILAANRSKASIIAPGTQLIIPTHRSIDTHSVKKVQPGDTVYMVRHGDTIAKISRKFNTTPSAIRVANLVDDNSLQEGIKIIIPTGNRFRA
jgi:membrane-bound lytic murein transglycosylase D